MPANRRSPSRETPYDRAMIGSIVGGRYRVLELVAVGGMARIFRAEQIPLGRMVALKILHPSLEVFKTDPALAIRFRTEAATCSRLAHPNIVMVHDYGPATYAGAESWYLTMEFIEGRTLSKARRAVGRFTLPRALRVTWEVCRALAVAHTLGIVHRDLKPANIMLLESAEGERVKVLDFGIAQVTDEASGELGDRVIGSPRYMSPEQIRRDPTDARVDIYSLGVILFELITGLPPFAQAEATAVMTAHLWDPAPSLSSALGRTVDPRVEGLVARCLAKDPHDRFPSAQALMQAIADCGQLPELAHRLSVQSIQGEELEEVDDSTDEACRTEPVLVPKDLSPPRKQAPRRSALGGLLDAAARGLGLQGSASGPEAGDPPVVAGLKT